MPITHAGSFFAAEGANTDDITATLPSLNDDDFGVLIGRAHTHAPTMAESSATWTEQFQIDNGSGTTLGKLAVWTKVLSSAESDPVLEIDAAEFHSLGLHVFRGVDPTTPLATWSTGDHYYENANAQLGPNAPIDTPVDGAAVLLIQALTSSTDPWAGGAAGAPSGHTLGRADFATRATLATAYVLDAGSAGTKTPGVWTHTGAGIGGGAEEFGATFALLPASGGNVRAGAVVVETLVDQVGNARFGATITETLVDQVGNARFGAVVIETLVTAGGGGGNAVVTGGRKRRRVVLF